ncbi:glutathione S-transferase 2-like [Clavelina lepadiformis]|uniref:glutathione S-transferase 2-like n=1 Tax=Clavelina lepadiformis TaxID=159417 RepID=UPI004040EA8D
MSNSFTRLIVTGNNRCRGEALRCVLEYLGVEYEDKRYKLSGKPPNTDGSSWFGVKAQMNLDLPNLPYIIDGDVRMTQAWAILKYLVRKHAILFPKTEEEIRNCDMLEEVGRDLAMPFYTFCYNHDDFDEAKKKYFGETLPKLLD